MAHFGTEETITVAGLFGGVAAVVSDIINGSISFIGVFSFDGMEVLLHALLYPACSALSVVGGRILYDLWKDTRNRKIEDRDESE